ncbi:MAG: PorP/SprF family type IX secretion system membrane protein [Flavobacteriales bacterium]|jgi:type IX secretion system PorP/SprF family membrane protein
MNQYLSLITVRSVVLCILLCLLLVLNSNAQQEWSHSQYQFNLYDVNAAYAGSHQTMSMAVRHRSQWMGLTGAPTSDQFSMHAPIAGEQMAAGLRVVSDRIGARMQLTAKATGVYKVRFQHSKLAFGITAGAVRQCVDIGMLNAQDSDDALLSGLSQARTVPTLGASVLFTSSRMFFGLDASHLNRAGWNYAQDPGSRLYRHYAMVAGVILPVGQEHLLELSNLTKYAEGGQWQSEVNAQFLYRNRCWIGGGYRFKSAIQALAAWMINDHLRVGLSYDYATGRQFARPSSSVEGFLGYTLNKRSAHSIRYF